MAWRRARVASDGSKGGNNLDAVTPGAALGTLYSSGVGTNKTKQHRQAGLRLGGLVTDGIASVRVKANVIHRHSSGVPPT